MEIHTTRLSYLHLPFSATEKACGDAAVVLITHLLISAVQRRVTEGKQLIILFSFWFSSVEKAFENKYCSHFDNYLVMLWKYTLQLF